MYNVGSDLYMATYNRNFASVCNLLIVNGVYMRPVYVNRAENSFIIIGNRGYFVNINNNSNNNINKFYILFILIDLP